MTAKTFILNGKHVLGILVCFFLSIAIANAIFITLAVRSFPGEQEKKSYIQGLAYNDRIAERNAQSSLGWSATITKADLRDGKLEIEIQYLSSSSTPVAGLLVKGLLARPAHDGGDYALEFVESEPGRYLAIVEPVNPGAWRLEAAALSLHDESFRLEKRLLLK